MKANSYKKKLKKFNKVKVKNGNLTKFNKILFWIKKLMSFKLKLSSIFQQMSLAILLYMIIKVLMNQEFRDRSS
jgi:hypothetical protein